MLQTRVADYMPGELDTLVAAGAIIWCGVEPLGEPNRHITSVLADQMPKLWNPAGHPATQAKGLSSKETQILNILKVEGALFIDTLHRQSYKPGPAKQMNQVGHCSGSNVAAGKPAVLYSVQSGFPDEP